MFFFLGKLERWAMEISMARDMRAHLRNHAPPTCPKNKFREAGSEISYRAHFLTIQLTCKGRFETGSNMKAIMIV